MELWLFVAIAAIVFCGVMAIVSAQRRSEKVREVGAREKFAVGKYVVGLPSQNVPINEVLCAVTPQDLVFLGGFGQELGRVARDSINNIILDDKSQITQRLTVTRMVTLGIFSLAVPKKTKHAEFCVVIDWDDENGARQNTVFEFTGIGAQIMANSVADGLRKATKPKVTRLMPDQKKCPFCAEIIKAEAKKCRYCDSDL